MNDIVLTVSQLNRYIKGIVEQDRVLCRVTIKGEISNFKEHFSGHLYFALKDEASVIKAVMFRSSAQGLKFMPESGQKVIATGRIGVFERDGQYQIYVDSMEPDGLGALHIAFEQLKEKLSGEGLFDENRKKHIPKFPSKIGVVTSPTGAAIRDILNVLKRRYRLANVYIYPVLVQGEEAPGEIVRAINYFSKSGWADVLIVGRGGGSIEDLWAFNSEEVARAVADCTVPVISAVGHETDFTIIDFVSDLRAPTPSAAAELAVPDTEELCEKLANCNSRLKGGLETLVKKKQTALENIKNRAVFMRPTEITDKRRLILDKACMELEGTMQRLVSEEKEELSGLVSKLDALSPLATLERGYSVAKQGGKVIKSVKTVDVGNNINVNLADGEILCEVKEVWKN